MDGSRGACFCLSQRRLRVAPRSARLQSVHMLLRRAKLAASMLQLRPVQPANLRSSTKPPIATYPGTPQQPQVVLPSHLTKLVPLSACWHKMPRGTLVPLYRLSQ